MFGICQAARKDSVPNKNGRVRNPAAIAAFAALVFSRFSHRYRIHAHLHSLFVLMFEFHLPIDSREQAVIRRAAHVLAGMKLRPALAHDDAAGRHEFPAESLHAEVFGIRMTPVARRADALLMSHACLSRDRKSTRLNSSHGYISYAVFCLKKKRKTPR